MLVLKERSSSCSEACEDGARARDFLAFPLTPVLLRGAEEVVVPDFIHCGAGTASQQGIDSQEWKPADLKGALQLTG
jgi:hypothetical protein